MSARHVTVLLWHEIDGSWSAWARTDVETLWSHVFNLLYQRIHVFAGPLDPKKHNTSVRNTTARLEKILQIGHAVMIHIMPRQPVILTVIKI